MLRALLWKEWRQQRQIAAAGVGIAVVVPPATFGILMASLDDVYAGDVIEMIPFMMAVFVWPLFAALSGATTNAQEVDVGSLGFLLSRPVTRTSVWVTKVVVAGAVVTLVVGVSFLVAELLGSLGGDTSIAFPFSADPVRTMTLPPAGVQVAALGFTGITFAAAVFVSMFLRRQVAAALSGVAVAAAVVVIGSRFQRVISATPQRSNGSEGFLAAFFVAAGVAILLAALYVFVAGSMLAGADKRRPLGRALAATACIVFLVAVVSAGAATRIDPKTAAVDLADVLPDGGAVLISLRHNNFGGSNFAIATPGEPLRVLTERLAVDGSVSPDGEWVAYTTRRGSLGLRRETCELRAVRVDGTGDHSVFDGTRCYPRHVFAEGAKRMAFMAQSTLWIVGVDGGEAPRPLRLVSTAAASGTALTWARDDSQVVVWSRRGISSVDVASGQVAELYGFEGSMQVILQAQSRRAAVLFARFTRARRGDGERPVPAVRLVFVDFETGDVHEVPWTCSDRYAEMTMSADGKTLVVRGCREDAADIKRLDLFRVDTGEARALAEFGSAVGEIEGSPAGSRIFVRTWGVDRTRNRNVYRNFVIDGTSGARLREVDGAWRATEWIDEERLVVWRRSRRSSQIGLLDVETGEVEMFVGRLPDSEVAQ